MFIYNIRIIIFFIQIKISDESVRNDTFKEKINCVVHICSCHNMNSFKRFCGRKKDDKERKIGKELKKLIMASCSRLMNCSNYGTIKNIFNQKICRRSINFMPKQKKKWLFLSIVYSLFLEDLGKNYTIVDKYFAFPKNFRNQPQQSASRVLVFYCEESLNEKVSNKWQGAKKKQVLWTSWFL